MSSYEKYRFSRYLTFPRVTECEPSLAFSEYYAMYCVSAGQVFGDSLLFIIGSWCSHTYHSVESMGNRSEFIGIVVKHTMCFFIIVL